MKSALAFLGAAYLIAMVLGALDIVDFHVYFGPDAKAWHLKHSK